MGTRATVKFYNEQGSHLVTVYHQFDGYFEGVGTDLANFLLSGELVNGFSDMSRFNKFNGAGCMAAQYIARFKTEAGGIYLMNAENKQEFNYKVSVENEVLVSCDYYDERIPYMSPEAFLNYIAEFF